MSLDCPLAERLRDAHKFFLRRGVGDDALPSSAFLSHWKGLAQELAQHSLTGILTKDSEQLARVVAHNVAVTAKERAALEHKVDGLVDDMVAELQSFRISHNHSTTSDCMASSSQRNPQLFHHRRGTKRRFSSAQDVASPHKKHRASRPIPQTLRDWFAANIASPFVIPIDQERMSHLFNLPAKKMNIDLSNWRRRSGWTHMRETYANGSREGMQILIDRIHDFQAGRQEGWVIDSNDLLNLGIWQRVPESERDRFTGTRRRVIDLGGRLRLGYTPEEEDEMFKCLEDIKKRLIQSREKVAPSIQRVIKPIFPFLASEPILITTTPSSTIPSLSTTHKRSVMRTLSSSSSSSSLAAVSDAGRISRSVSMSSTGSLAEVEQSAVAIKPVEAPAAMATKASAFGLGNQQRDLRWSYTVPESFVFGKAEQDARTFFPHLPLYDLGVASWDDAAQKQSLRV